ncbi:MAG: pyruvate dehydrogenase complex dihydrolipoamide acetyltransferase [Bacteroidetes bacterium]|nr:pyruvate dehydrogenase complex dihydrolipoamide acetyltransferase [Bacteroidota bacterium]
MAEVIRMPKLSDTMTEGVVANWNKKVGDTVKRGEILAEIETDKATMEFESFFNGTLLYIGIEKGKGAPVDAIIAIIGEKGEDVNAILAAEKNKVPEKKEEKVSEKKIETVVAKKEVAKQAPKKITVHSEENGNRIIASPLAKKLADEKGIDIFYVKGSGDHGRVIKRDIDYWNPSKMPPVMEYDISVNKAGEYTDEPVSQMRKIIAKRLSESKFSAPHFYLTMEIDMMNAVSVREKLNAKGETKISFNDMVIRAVAQSLKSHPKVNSSWYGDRIRFNHEINIGVAVAVEEGLLVPVVRNADKKSYAEIGAEVKVFAQKAKDKKLQPTDWEGNTFTISNLGMFGIDEFTAIINPPDSCILAVGGIKDTPVVKDGKIVAGKIMKVTMSCDHRVVDGVTGSAFLQTLKKVLENPASQA